MEENENNFVPFIPLRNANNGNPGSEQFDIEGLKIQAFYDSSHKLLFVLDLTQDKVLPNIMLVIDARQDRKWDDILENDFHIKPETVRPREGHKYKKLDINYEGLDLYSNAIANKNASELKKWRSAISDKQKSFRIREAKHDENLARETVQKAKETISNLDEFITTHKAKLKAAKKQIGKEVPKDSAANILRFEAKIEKAEAKRNRAKIRLRRAEKRIESSIKTLNNYNYTRENEMDGNNVKPLFTKEPNITETKNAFKPISFEPKQPQTTQPSQQPKPTPMPKQTEAPQPTLGPQPIPMSQLAKRPIAPVSGGDIKISNGEQNQSSGAYYMMLIVLIGLSIFTLYLYQQKMGSSEMPNIATTQPSPATVEPTKPAAVEVIPESIPETVPETAPESVPESAPAPSYENPFIEPEAAPSTPASAPAPKNLAPVNPTPAPENLAPTAPENLAPAALENLAPAAPAVEEQFFQPLTETPAPTGTGSEPAVSDNLKPEPIASEQIVAPQQAANQIAPESEAPIYQPNNEIINEKMKE